MKRVKCQSGIEGSQEKLHKIYTGYKEFFAYSELFGLAKKLGYKSPEAAWKANPTVESSSEPSAYLKAPQGSARLRKAPQGSARLAKFHFPLAFLLWL
jgi:hypothetical protein